MPANAPAGQPELCEECWAPGASGAHAALRHLLGAARGLFPAAPAPLLRLLAALASGRAAAAAASAYLSRLPAVACLHPHGDPRVRRLRADEGDAGGGGEAGARVVADAPIALANAVSLPEVGRPRLGCHGCGRDKFAGKSRARGLHLFSPYPTS